MDDPDLTDTLQHLPLLSDVALEPLKDKIAETLPALLTQPLIYPEERWFRKQCARFARKLRRFRYLGDPEDLVDRERMRPLRRRVQALAKDLERRADGIEAYGTIQVLRHHPHQQSDHRLVYDYAVLNLFAILRHLTHERRGNKTLFFTVMADIFEAVGVLPESGEDPVEAVKKRFQRANFRRWRGGGPPLVDFHEDQLFFGDHRFPARPPRVPPQYRSIPTDPSSPAPIPPPETAPDR